MINNEIIKQDEYIILETEKSNRYKLMSKQSNNIDGGVEFILGDDDNHVIEMYIYSKPKSIIENFYTIFFKLLKDKLNGGIDAIEFSHDRNISKNKLSEDKIDKLAKLYKIIINKFNKLNYVTYSGYNEHGEQHFVICKDINSFKDLVCNNILRTTIDLIDSGLKNLAKTNIQNLQELNDEEINDILHKLFDIYTIKNKSVIFRYDENEYNRRTKMRKVRLKLSSNYYGKLNSSLDIKILEDYINKRSYNWNKDK